MPLTPNEHCMATTIITQNTYSRKERMYANSKMPNMNRKIERKRVEKSCRHGRNLKPEFELINMIVHGHGSTSALRKNVIILRRLCGGTRDAIAFSTHSKRTPLMTEATKAIFAHTPNNMHWA